MTFVNMERIEKRFNNQSLMVRFLLVLKMGL